MQLTSLSVALACAALIAAPRAAIADDPTIPFVFPSMSPAANAETFNTYTTGEVLAIQGVPAGALDRNLRGLLDGLRPALESVASETVGAHRIETIELHILVNAEGSIGVASGGVEGGIRLVFQRTD